MGSGVCVGHRQSQKENSTLKIRVSYKAANSNSKEVQFCLTSVFVSCVVCRVAHAHRYGCSCSSFWADMSTDSTGCLGARKCQGLTKRVV